MTRFDSLAGAAGDQTRRAFVAGVAGRMLGVVALPWLGGFAAAGTAAGRRSRPATATAQRVIYLYMSGGMSHLDTFDPKPGSPAMGPTAAIATKVDGLMVSAHFPELARRMDRVAVVRSLTSTQGAHAQGRYFLHTSYLMRGTIRHPSLGAWLSHLAGPDNPTLPPHVAIGGDIYGASGGFLASRHGPLPIGDPQRGLRDAQMPATISDEVFHRRLERLDRMNRAFEDRFGSEKIVRNYADAYDQALKLMRSEDLAAFDLAAEPGALRDAYGRDDFGQGVLLARRLCEHGVRFVEVQSGGWDTHVDHFDAMDAKCPQLDRTLVALLADLESRGMLDDTLVVLATEFGRTPEITTERAGRDHHPQAFSGLLAGGGIRGGVCHGATDERGAEVVADPVTLPDFNATIARALGLDLEQESISPTGRPFRVADRGRPIAALFA